RADTSAPIILTKSSHDLDILQWLMGEPVASVASYGSLSYFTAEHSPEGATERCIDCPHRDDCLYSATRFYLNERDDWPFNVVSPLENTIAARRRAIAEGPYGRCVYLNDNDVCDNQIVVLEFASGAVATFGLHAHTWDNTRKITILMDRGEIAGDLHRNEIYVSHFTGAPDEVRREHYNPSPQVEQQDYHGGGDVELLYALYDHLTGGDRDDIISSLSSSLASHALAFLAEQSRLAGSAKVPVPEIFASVTNGTSAPGAAPARGEGKRRVRG
ncbi:MAG: Gfo/Idh/MocA family oxidoreductase, partial [Gemmatimonadota bacterium]